jgi:hypothetical protein
MENLTEDQIKQLINEKFKSFDNKYSGRLNELSHKVTQIEESKNELNNEIKQLTTEMNYIFENFDLMKNFQIFRFELNAEIYQIKKSLKAFDISQLKKMDKSLANYPTINISNLHYCKGKINSCAGNDNYVYGNNPYTDDSNKCSAAVHSGLIDTNGGFFIVQSTGYKDTFESIKKNGISSNYYGRWNSITLIPFTEHYTTEMKNCGKVNL